MSKGKRLLNLDILRVLAIFMVTIYHLWKRMGKPTYMLGAFDLYGMAHYGNIGVIIMLVLSGYLVVGSYNKYSQLPVGRRLKKFYIERFLRIAPAYYIAIFVWCILIEFGLTVKPNGIKDVLSHMLFIHAASDATKYSISGVMWYMSIQAAFYVLTPLILFVALKIKNMIKRDVPRKILIFFGFGVLLILAGYGVNTKMLEYHSILVMLPSFLLGIILYYIRNEKHILLGVFLSIFGIILLFATRKSMNEFFGTSAYRILLGLIISAGFILLSGLRIPKVFDSALILLSNASYSIYLYNYIMYAFTEVPKSLGILLVYGMFVGGFGIIMHLALERPLLDCIKVFQIKQCEQPALKK